MEDKILSFLTTGRSLDEIAEHIERHRMSAYARLQKLKAKGLVEMSGKRGSINAKWWLAGKVPVKQPKASEVAKRLQEREAKLLARIGWSEGASMADIRHLEKLNDTVWHKTLQRLLAEGKIERIGGAGSKASRYFLPGMAPVVKPKEKKKEPQKPQGEVITPVGVKVTICPSWTHDHRYQVAPGVKVKGEFSSRKMGEYL